MKHLYGYLSAKKQWIKDDWETLYLPQWDECALDSAIRIIEPPEQQSPVPGSYMLMMGWGAAQIHGFDVVDIRREWTQYVHPIWVPKRFRSFAWWDRDNEYWCRDCWQTGFMESLGGRETPCLCGFEEPEVSPVYLPQPVSVPDGYRGLSSHYQLTLTWWMPMFI